MDATGDPNALSDVTDPPSLPLTDTGDAERSWTRKAGFFFAVIVPTIALVVYSLYTLFFIEGKERCELARAAEILFVLTLCITGYLWDRSRRR